MDGSPPGSSVHGILQARILEWVAMPSSRGSSWPRDRTPVSHVSWAGRQFLCHWATWEAPQLLSLIQYNIVTISWIGYIGAVLIIYQYGLYKLPIWLNGGAQKRLYQWIGGEPTYTGLCPLSIFWVINRLKNLFVYCLIAPHHLLSPFSPLPNITGMGASLSH